MGRHLAMGTDGTLIVTGNFEGSIDLGGGALTSNGGHDIYVATYSQAGIHRWSTSFGGAGFDDLSRVAIDPRGAIYFVAQFQETVDFGGGPIVSAGHSDLAIGRMTTFGKVEWAIRFGGALSEAPAAIAVGSDGNVYVVGGFSGTAAVGKTSLTSAGESDAFLLALTPTGDVRWARAIGGTYDDSASGVGVSADGSVYVSGYFAGAMDTAPSSPIQAVGASDAFVMRYDAAGERLWSKIVSSGANDRLLDLATQGDRVVVTGNVGPSAMIGGTKLDNSGTTPGIVAALDSAGALSWFQVFGHMKSGSGEAIAISANGSIVVGGSTTGRSVFGSDPVQEGGYMNPFVAILESDGTPRWGKVLPTHPWGIATGVAAPSDGFAFVAGWFAGSIDFGDGELEATDLEDMFLFRVAPPSP